MKRITVVICTRNRSAVLIEPLKGLCNQNLSTDVFDVLVIDNASTDGTKELVEGFQNCELSLRYIREEHVGLSYARNRALSEVSTPFIAYLDDDAVPTSQWLESLLNTFDSIYPLPAAVGGKILLEWGGTPPVWFHEDLFWMVGYLNYGEEIKEVAFINGGNMAYRTDVLKAYGGFDPRLGMRGDLLGGGEETDIQIRLKNDAQRIYYHPNATVWHIVGPLRQQPRYITERSWMSGRIWVNQKYLRSRPGNLALLKLILAALFHEKRLLLNTLMSILTAHSFYPQKEKFLIRCRFFGFLGAEYELIRLFLNRTSISLN